MSTQPAADAVVLVGGQGTRLRPLTLTTPKPMLPTAGVPFLEQLLSRISQAGITHVILGTSYATRTRCIVTSALLSRCVCRRPARSTPERMPPLKISTSSARRRS